MSKTLLQASWGLQAKVTLVVAAISMSVVLIVAAVGFQIVRGELEAQLRGKLLSAVTLGARVFSSSEVLPLDAQISLGLEASEALNVMNSEEFRVVSEKLNLIRATDPAIIRFVYLIAREDSSGKGYYLADADVLNGGDGPLSLPGTPFSFDEYPVAGEVLTQKAPRLEADFTLDAEFHVRSISGYAPLFDRTGAELGILGIDMVDTDVSAALARATQWIVGAGFAALIAALLVSLLLARILTRNLISLQRTVERFGQKDYSARAEIRSRDEVGALGTSFNAMAQALVDDQAVIAAAEREAARNAESRKYLENISQGLLFTDDQWTIGGQYSRYLTKMFQLESSPEGWALVDLLYPDTPEQARPRAQLTEYFDKLKRGSATDRSRLEAENPLKNASIPLRSGQSLVVDARFLLLESEGRLSNVMVLFDDRTEQAQSARVLEDERSLHEAEMEFLLTLVKHGLPEVQSYMGELDKLLASPESQRTAQGRLQELRSRATSLDLLGLSRELWAYEAEPSDQHWALLSNLVLQTKGFVEKAGAFGEQSGDTSLRNDFEKDWKDLSERAQGWAQGLSKTVRLTARVDDDCLLAVHELREVIAHLVKNAVTHGLELPAERTAKGKPAVGEIIVEARADAKNWQLSVIDDGTGLEVGGLRRKLAGSSSSLPSDATPAQVVEALFQPSNGLGLGETAETIRRFKGSLSVKSQRGRGATFVIRLAPTFPY